MSAPTNSGETVWKKSEEKQRSNKETIASKIRTRKLSDELSHCVMHHATNMYETEEQR